MIFFIFAYIAEQNAGICSPNMILGDIFDAVIIIYVFTEIWKGKYQWFHEDLAINVNYYSFLIRRIC